MTIPARSTVFVAIVLTPLLVGAVFEPILLYVVLAGDLLLALLCIKDGRRLSRFQITVCREDWSRLQTNREAELIYSIENRENQAVVVHLRQWLPSSIYTDTNNIEAYVGPGEVVKIALKVTPHKRGMIAIPPAEVDIRFHPICWARWRWNLTPETSVTVYPNLEGLYEYDVLRQKRALNQFGIHRMRMVGAGREFEQLRKYSPDDDFRDINWKATARRHRLITNVYQSEKSQDVLLCLDCGRMMANPVGKGVALDKAIDASIMLANVVNKQGDQAGLALFKDAVNLYIRPKGGNAALTNIVEKLVHVEPEEVFPSYAVLVNKLRVSHKKRSMIFLFTDLNDPQFASDLAKVLPLISRRHVIVVVSLRDPIISSVASGKAENKRGIYRVLAARKLMSERETRLRDLGKHGVQVLETDAENLALEVINKYLQVKMRQLL